MELAARAVRITRDSGALAVLPNALTYRACVHVLAGEFAAALALIEEAYAISEATGNAPLRYPSLLLAAWRGQEAEAKCDRALNVIEAGIEDATSRGLGRAIGFAQYVTAVLHNGLGRYREALAAAQGACAHDDLGLYGWALTELVEAGVRSDESRRRVRRTAPARRTDPRHRHRLGAGDRGAFAGAAERRRGGRPPLPRGDRAAWAHPHPRGADPRASPLRRMAAPRESEG